MSFSAEMKDFLSAYKTGQSINASRTTQDYQLAQKDALEKKTTRDNDPDTLELQDKQARAELAKTQDSLATGAANRAHLGATTAYTNALAKRLAQSPVTQGSGLMPTGAISPTGGAQPSPGALPIGPSTMDTEEAFADGGMVPDDEADEGAPDNEAAEAGAVPANAPTDVSARGRAPAGIQGVVAPELVHDAVKAGMTWGANAYGLTGTGALRTPSQAAQAKLLAQGHGGLTAEEMEAAKKAVDPEGKLTESQRNMAALGSVYQFWANKGDGEKASKVAFQMLQHYRNASARYAAIAAHAAQGGNVDLATKAAMRAYANVPDGNDMELLPNPDGGIMYAVTGPNGDVVTKGIATPQQLAASAMGLASGGFDKALLSAAGAQEAATKGGAVGKPQTAADRAKEGELPTGPINAMKETWQTKNPDAKPDEEMWQQAHDVAQHILQQNPKVLAGEAARAAHILINPGKADPEKPDFKVTPGEEGQPHTVQFGNGMKVKLDDDQLGVIMNSRAARIKQANDKINADMEASDKPSRTEQAIEGAKQVGTGALDLVKDALPAVQTVGRILKSEAGNLIPDELKQRVGSDLSQIGEIISRRSRNTGAVPVDDGDRPL